MNENLIIRNYINGTDSDPLFMNKEPISITSYAFSSSRMGSVSLSASLMYPLCLDDFWDGTQYVKFRGENYFIRQIPSSSKDNTDTRYKHEIVFVSGRDILNNVYFFDVVSDNPNSNDKYVSNSTKVVFMGTINEFAERLNRSLIYSNLSYRVVVDESISTEAKLITFEDQYIYNVLQESYNIFNIPYYFKGEVIHFGFVGNAITQPFRYGHDSQLLDISKTNANYKIVNRITGVGSTDNIPHYYPNESDDRAAIEAAGGKWITPTQNLMPPIYRETKGANRFYNAINNTYPIPDSDPLSYYYFENEYKATNPKEHKVSFDDIKPTIKNIVNASNQRIDVIADIAFDTNDNDDVDENNNYLHPYFYVKLNKINGIYGFNLFDQAIAKNEMQLSLTSGNCAACTFMIGVDDELQKNVVQVDDNGNLKRDKDGNVIRSGKPQDRQNDTINYNVWIALKKDIDTFGVIMPNALGNYKPSTNDTFVLLGINLPQAYITNAEDRLKQELIKYMAENNSEKFNFSINFSSVYLAENTEIANQLNENASILIEYDGKTYPLYVSNYTYQQEDSDLLPKISVDLSETITIVRGQLQNALDSVKDEILNEVSSSDFIKQGLKYFLRKDIGDTAQGLMKFLKGAHFGSFVNSITAGKGAAIDQNGNAQFESVEVRGYMKIMELIINRLSATQSDYVFTESGNCSSVEDLGQNTYRLTMRKSYDFDFTSLKEDDIIYSIVNNILSSGEYYTVWMRVISVNISANTITAVLFPASECPTGKNFPPIENINIARRGNATDKTRQSCFYLSSSEGAIIFLDGVTKPILEDYNYQMILGKPKHLKIFDNLPINFDHTYLYVRGLIYQDSFHVRHTGVPVRQEIYRGEWSSQVASSEDPYRYTETEVHVVYHVGCKWSCYIDKTRDIPKWNSPAWVMIEGNNNLSVDFLSSNGYGFVRGRVDTSVTPICWLGHIDISNDILTNDWEWTRDSGLPVEDTQWNVAHTANGRVLHLTNDDMPSNWSIKNKVKFTCSAYVRDGKDIYKVSNSIIA